MADALEQLKEIDRRAISKHNNAIVIIKDHEANLNILASNQHR